MSTEHRQPNDGQPLHFNVRRSTFDVGRSFLPALALGVVCAVYVSTLSTLHPSVFWSPDEGAKFIQMHGRLVSPGAAHRMAYGAASSDPFFVFYPAAPIYPQPLWPSGVHHHWPALFPALSLPFFQILGVWGLYMLPLASGVLTSALAGVMAQRLAPGAAVPAILLAGLASPLYFHSMLFLEHSVACALALGSLLCGWGLFRGSLRRRLVCSIGAVVCLAGFYALRDEALIFLAALAALGAATLTTGRIRTVGLAGIALGPLLLLAVPGGTISSSGGGRAAELLGDAVNALAGLKDPALWRALPQHLLHVLVNNPAHSGVPLPPEWAVTCLFGLVLCALSPVVVAPQRFACWLAGVCLVAAGAAYGLCLPDRYRAIHGLLLPMPALALAWLPTPDDTARPGKGERFLTALLSLMLVLHLLTTWLLRRPAGGPEWGLRYALVAYLLAAVLGAAAVVRFSRTSRGWRRFAGLGLAASLLVLSCGYGMRGIFELQVTKRDLHAFEREILQAGAPVVTDQWWLAAALAPSFVRTQFYTLNPGTDPRLWLDRIGSRASSFVYVSYALPPNEVRFAHGLTATLTQRRAIQDMTFSRFAVRGTP
jgi:hypothetical protein